MTKNLLALLTSGFMIYGASNVFAVEISDLYPEIESALHSSFSSSSCSNSSLPLYINEAKEFINHLANFLIDPDEVSTKLGFWNEISPQARDSLFNIYNNYLEEKRKEVYQMKTPLKSGEFEYESLTDQYKHLDDAQSKLSEFWSSFF